MTRDEISKIHPRNPLSPHKGYNQDDFLLEQAREQGRAEMRELMACGHPKACLVERMVPSDDDPGVNITSYAECSACARERRFKLATIEACAKVIEPFADSQEFAATIRDISPDDIKVE